MQDLLTAISDVFSMKAVQSKIQSCKEGKIKITPDFKGIPLLPFDIIPISTEGILSTLCSFFVHDFKTEVADVVRKKYKMHYLPPA